VTTAVRSRVHAHISLWTLVYLVIGFIVAISQDYWDFTAWDGHELASFLTAVAATLFWPIAIFYTFALSPR
jgi:hypothetical protein